MPSYAYVHMGSDTGTPLTLLVYLDPPYDVVSVDSGPFVRERVIAPPPDAPAGARTYELSGEVVPNATSGEAVVGR
jgi:hypothetical protein